MRKALFAACLLLAGCGSNNNPPRPAPPPPAPSPLPATIAPSAPWAITEGSSPAAIINGGFDFLVCPSASTCWISYIEVPFSYSLATASSITLNYAITGSNPVFAFDSPNNICNGTANLSLFIHQAGDNLSGVGPYSYYRQFATPQAQPLALGTFTLSVPLTVDKWVPVYPPPNGAGFATALANIGSVGFVLGGGCFAGHGVAVTKGSARLTINSMQVQ